MVKKKTEGTDMISRIEDRTRLIHDGYHRCPTYRGQTIRCRIRIVENRWNTVVTATDHSDSIYSSITLHTEELAAAICATFDLDIHKLLWIEHIPARADLGRPEDLYDLVHFDKSGGALTRPHWTPLTEEEMEILTDGLLQPEPTR